MCLLTCSAVIERWGTYFRYICIYKIGGGLQALVVFLGGFLADVVGGAELDVGFFQVGSDAASDH